MNMGEEKIEERTDKDLLVIRKINHYYGKAKALEELNLKVTVG